MFAPRFLTLMVCAAAVLGCPRLSMAQHDINEICGPALLKDYTSTIRSDQQKIAWFKAIDQKTYELIKHDAGFRLGLPIPVVGEIIGMIDASANYSDFSEKRTEHLEREGYVSDIAREERDLRIVTSPIAYSAWTQCVEAFARPAKIVTAYKDQEDKETVRVMIVNATPVNIRLHSDLLNGTVAGQKAGTAFKDGMVISAGGAFPVLIRRAGNGKLKLSMSANPAWDIPVIESEWGDAPKEYMRGNLRVTLRNPQPQDRGNQLGEEWTWPDMHNEDCDGSPVCSNDGKWKATEHTLTVNASDSRYFLENVWYECLAGACEWNAGQRKVCRVHDGRKAGSCTIVAASGATRYRIWGKQIEYQDAPVQRAPIPVLLFGRQQQFTLSVPDDAATAIFEYTNNAGSSALKPGDQSSPDGRIVLLGTTSGGGAKSYTYRHN